MKKPMVSDAQKRAHQKHEGERKKRSPIWLEPALAKKVARAVKKLGLPSRVAWVEHVLQKAQSND
jgi:ABC-type Zn2+ transport system substrate-binding protein/surface adhesin